MKKIVIALLFRTASLLCLALAYVIMHRMARTWYR